MALGPIVQVKTVAAKVRLDVARALDYPQGTTLRFLKAGPSGGWATVKEYTGGFNRQPALERERGDGRTIIVHYADDKGTFESDTAQATHFALYISGHLGQVAPFSTTERPAENVAQVYQIEGTVRGARRPAFEQR